MRTHVNILTLKTTNKVLEGVTRHLLSRRNKHVQMSRDFYKNEDGTYAVKHQTLPRKIKYESLKIKRIRFVITDVSKDFYESKIDKLIEFIYKYVFETAVNGNYHEISKFTNRSFYIDIPPYLYHLVPADAFISPTSIGVLNTGIKHILKGSDYIPAQTDALLNKKLVEIMFADGDIDAVRKILKLLKKEPGFAGVATTIAGWQEVLKKRSAGCL